MSATRDWRNRGFVRPARRNRAARELWPCLPALVIGLLAFAVLAGFVYLMAEAVIGGRISFGRGRDRGRFEMSGIPARLVAGGFLCLLLGYVRMWWVGQRIYDEHGEPETKVDPIVRGLFIATVFLLATGFSLIGLNFLP